jgi:3-hydroxyisobutyrate dehydrogenase-like beta-hydroxyacid dehydrogenase
MAKKVGVVGVGNMGFGMGCNLLKAEFEVVAYDLRPEPLEALRVKGASIAPDLATVGRECPLVFSVVLDYKQNMRILDGPRGLLESMNPGSVVFVCSTISPGQATELASLASRKNIRLLDCPVSGGQSGADNGTLTLMIGGQREAIDEHRQALEAISNKIYHLGDVGMGETAKAVNQALVAIHYVATAEALLLSAKSGLNLKQMMDIIISSEGYSRIFETRGKRMMDRKFEPVGVLKVIVKDTGIVLNTADSLNLSMPMTSIARQMFQTGVNQGLGEEGSSAIVKVLEKMAGFSLADVKEKKEREGA